MSEQNYRYDILDKLFESVIWSSGRADGSSWSNIFWSREDLMRYAGLNPDHDGVKKKAFRQMKDQFETDCDQMYLYGFKDGMPQGEIEHEVGETSRKNKYVLSDIKPNPVLADVDHKWEIDAEVYENSYKSSRINELFNYYETYKQARQAINDYLVEKHPHEMHAIKYSDYAYKYDFADGSYALIVIYPIANEKYVEKEMDDWKKNHSKKKVHHEK